MSYLLKSILILSIFSASFTVTSAVFAAESDLENTVKCKIKVSASTNNGPLIARHGRIVMTRQRTSH